MRTLLRALSPRPPPAVLSKRHAAAPQRHALGFEAEPLRQHARHARPGADAAARVHHAVPRQILRTARERLPDRSRGPRPSQPRGDLSVRCHAAAGNRPHEPPDRAPEPHADPLRAASSQSRAYRPPRRSRSAWRPSSCTRPWWSTRMRSTPWTVESRWAIVIVVRPRATRIIALRISASDSGSTLDVASSRTRIAGLYTRARAMARSWRCPC